MLDRLDETIVAISSAPGCGPRGIVRLSGGGALALVERMSFVSGGLSALPGSRQAWGEVLIDDNLGVPAVFYLFRAPRSYTREDLIEIHTIGSPPLLEAVRQRAIALGALPAEAGEFTARAFLHGRLSLAQAEGVAGIIRAESDAQLRAARRQMDGRFAGRITEARTALAELLALVEADIDFAEEPIDFISPEQLRIRLDALSHQLEDLVAGAISSERLTGLPRILLIGPPNAGKSSLMNALSGTRRAICAAVAGTTRDILTAPCRLGRGEALLLDTAGLDASTDEIIAMARSLTLSEADRVDLLCIVLAADEPPGDEFLALAGSLGTCSAVVAINKCDLGAPLPEVEAAAARWSDAPVVHASALAETGLDALRTAMTDRISTATINIESASMIITQRQGNAVGKAAGAIGRAGELASSAAETIDCADVVAFELREALASLAEVTGEVTTEDLLGEIFANFCIGK